MPRLKFSTNRPIWPEGPRPAARPTLRTHEKVDVAVIGAGITGLIAALNLIRAGKSVIVLESGALLDGETARSTAITTEILDADLERLVTRFGVEPIRHFSQMHRMAIHRLGALIEELGGPGACGWKRVPAYWFAENEADAIRLRNLLPLLEKLQISVSQTRQLPAPLPVAEALRLEDQARLDPAALIRLLASAVANEQGRLFEHTPAQRLVPLGRSVRIETPHGSVSCEQCIVATGSPVLGISLAHLSLVPLRTYVLAARLKTPPAAEGVYWSFATPTHYYRHFDGILLAGGEDHRTGRNGSTATKSEAKLEDHVRARFDVASIEACWSGQILETFDGLPLCGNSLRSDRIWYATGYGGNGISLGALCAGLLSDAVLGRRDELLRTFAPHRVVRPNELRRAAAHALVHPLNVIGRRIGHRLVEAVRREPPFKPEDLAPNEARVGEIQGERVAAFRDSGGALHQVSARCTHLGGEVCFNEQEKTWDCPCHGSRFDMDGRVLCGPATRDLKARGRVSPRVAAPVPLEARPGKKKTSKKPGKRVA